MMYTRSAEWKVHGRLPTTGQDSWMSHAMEQEYMRPATAGSDADRLHHSGRTRSTVDRHSTSSLALSPTYPSRDTSSTKTCPHPQLSGLNDTNIVHDKTHIPYGGDHTQQRKVDDRLKCGHTWQTTMWRQQLEVFCVNCLNTQWLFQHRTK